SLDHARTDVNVVAGRGDRSADLTDALTQRGVEVEDVYPASPMQAGMVFHSVQEPESGLYVEQSVATLRGALNVDALGRAWRDLVARHAILRTAFAWDGLVEPQQIVERTIELPFEALDWHALPATDRDERLSAFLATDRARGWRLERAPLWRVT